MKLDVGYSNRLIASEADFNNLAIIYNILIVATLIALWIIGEPEYMDYDNFEISKVTFRGTMGMLAILMAANYYAVSVSGILFALVIGVINHLRIAKEMGMLHGFLTLAFFLMNLFGFFGGVLCLLVSPPFLFLVQQFAKFRNVKESQD